MAGVASFGGRPIASLAKGLGPKLSFGAFAALALAWSAQPAHAGYAFQDNQQYRSDIQSRVGN